MSSNLGQIAELSRAASSDLLRWQAFASEVISNWKAGDDADTQRLLCENPALGRHRSIVLDLAYEEYCLRTDRGEVVSADEFCAKFSGLESSLRRQLELHKFFDERPDFLSKFTKTWPKVGDRFLGYHLEDIIGRGAFATVYYAKEIALGSREVVLKITQNGASEANTLGKLQHPNIVPIHSVSIDESSGLTAICMPYLGRATLQDVVNIVATLDTDELPTASVYTDAVRGANNFSYCNDTPKEDDTEMTFGHVTAEIVSTIAEALDHAHSRGILHLDLKPSNILLTSVNGAMLLDFNLARDYQEDFVRMGGTIPYMSPEQLKASQARKQGSLAIDYRSDIFSLGVLTYELVCGRVPFPIDSSADGLNSALITTQLKAQERGADFSDFLRRTRNPKLVAIVKRCMSFDASVRPGSAKEIADALHATIRRPSRGTLHRRLIAVTLATLAALFLTVGARSAVERQSREARSAEQTPTDLSDLGSQYAEAGDVAMALICLHKAVQLEATPERLIQLAYYCSLSGHPSDAIYWYERATAVGGSSAAVYNNLGFAYRQVSRLERARQQLLKALALDPNHRTALHNLAMVEFDLARQAKHFPTAAVARIESALAVGNANGRLHRDAAIIYAYAATIDADYASKVTDQLKLAINMGHDEFELEGHPEVAQYLVRSDSSAPRRRRDGDASPGIAFYLDSSVCVGSPLRAIHHATR